MSKNLKKAALLLVMTPFLMAGSCETQPPGGGGGNGAIPYYEQFVVVTSNPSSMFRNAGPSLEAHIFHPARTVNDGGQLRNLPNRVFGPFDVLSSTVAGRQSAIVPDMRIPAALASNGYEYVIAFFSIDGEFWTAQSFDGADWIDLRSLGRLTKFNHGGGLLDISETEFGRPHLYYDFDNRAWRAILREASGGQLWSVDLAEPQPKAKLISLPGNTSTSGVFSIFPAPAGFISATGDLGVNTSYSLFDTAYQTGGALLRTKNFKHLSNPPGMEVVDASIVHDAAGAEIFTDSGPGFTSLLGSEIYLSTSKVRTIPGESGFTTSDINVYKREENEWRRFNTTLQGVAPASIVSTSIAADSHAVVVVAPGDGLRVSRLLENQNTGEVRAQPWERVALQTIDSKSAPIAIGPYRPVAGRPTGPNGTGETNPCAGPANSFEFYIQKLKRGPERGEVFGLSEYEDLRVNIEVVTTVDPQNLRVLQRYPVSDIDSVRDGSWTRQRVNLIQGFRPNASLNDLITTPLTLSRGQSVRITVVGTHDNYTHSLLISFDEIMNLAQNTTRGRAVRAGAARQDIPRVSPAANSDSGFFGVDWNVSVYCLGN